MLICAWISLSLGQAIWSYTATSARDITNSSWSITLTSRVTYDPISAAIDFRFSGSLSPMMRSPSFSLATQPNNLTLSFMLYGDSRCGFQVCPQTSPCTTLTFAGSVTSVQSFSFPTADSSFFVQVGRLDFSQNSVGTCFFNYLTIATQSLPRCCVSGCGTNCNCPVESPGVGLVCNNGVWNIPPQDGTVAVSSLTVRPGDVVAVQSNVVCAGDAIFQAGSTLEIGFGQSIAVLGSVQVAAHTKLIVDVTGQSNVDGGSVVLTGNSFAGTFTDTLMSCSNVVSPASLSATGSTLVAIGLSPCVVPDTTWKIPVFVCCAVIALCVVLGVTFLVVRRVRAEARQREELTAEEKNRARNIALATLANLEHGEYLI